MKIAIDLDNTITSTDKSSSFFSLITNLLKGKARIYIITNRDPSTASEIEIILEDLNIYFDCLIMTAEKEKWIIDEKIDVFFEDTDEYFLDLPKEVVVFKIREDGNFDFSDKKWIYGDKTGKKL